MGWTLNRNGGIRVLYLRARETKKVHNMNVRGNWYDHLEYDDVRAISDQAEKPVLCVHRDELRPAPMFRNIFFFTRSRYRTSYLRIAVRHCNP